MKVHIINKDPDYEITFTSDDLFLLKEVLREVDLSKEYSSRSDDKKELVRSIILLGNGSA